MNKRIDDLAEQAGVTFNTQVVRLGPYAYFDHRKFAELIVRECMMMCQARADNPATQGSFRDGALLCANDIKLHFGVKE